MLKSKLISALIVGAAISVMTMGCSRATTLTIITTSLKNGSVGVVYSQKLQAAGGKAPYIWLISRGALPNGLKLNAGEISGTPAVEGSFSFTIVAGDKEGVTTNMDFSITIQQVNAVIATTRLAQGKVGTRYSQTLVAKKGVSPYRWSLTDGNLPAGLTLNEGVISGTPYVAGVFDFTILLEDNAGSETLAGLSITVLSNP